MGLYYLCRENKGVDQLHGSQAADLCLFFEYAKNWFSYIKWIINLFMPHITNRDIGQHMSSVKRKSAFCICENKDADQLRGNREADQRLCFRHMDSAIPLLSKSEISSL